MSKKVVHSHVRALHRSRMSTEQRVAALEKLVDELVYEPDPEPEPEPPAPEAAQTESEPMKD